MSLFIEDFDQIDDIADPAPAAPVAAALLDEAYARGVADGVARRQAEDDAAARLLAERCTEEFRRAEDSLGEMADHAADQLARLMFGVLESLVPEICAACGPAEISALTRTLLPQLRSEPRIRIRLNPHDAPGVLAQMDVLNDDVRDRVVVTQTDAVARGDIRVTWQDGEMLRDTAAIWQQVADALCQFGFLDAAAAKPASVQGRGRTQQVVEHAR